jgi:hypothetical protein
MRNCAYSQVCRPTFGFREGAPGKTVKEKPTVFVLNRQVGVSASGLRSSGGCTYNFEGFGLLIGMRREDWPAGQGAAGLHQ